MGHKVLLADDSITVQKIVKLSLTEEGIEVIALGNGEQAVQELDALQPDLVMADVFMPGKDGYEVCEFIKSHPQYKHIPVILLVHAFEPFDPDRAKKVGADQQLTKPFQSIRTLVTTVRDLLIEPPAAVVSENVIMAPSALEAPLSAPEPLVPPPALAMTPVVTEEFAAMSSLTPPGMSRDEAAFGSFSLADTEVPPAAPAMDALPPFPFPEAGAMMDAPTPGFAIEGLPESVAPDALPPLGLAMLPPNDWSSPSTAVTPPLDDVPAPSPLTLAATEAGEAMDDVLDLSEVLAPNAAPPDAGTGLATVFAPLNETPLLAVLPSPAEPGPTNPTVVDSNEAASFTTAFDLGVGQVQLDPLASDPMVASEVALSPSPAMPLSGEATPMAQPHGGLPISEAVIEEIVNRVVQRLSTQAIQEIAWEVVPEMAELLIRKQISQHPQLSH